MTDMAVECLAYIPILGSLSSHRGYRPCCNINIEIFAPLLLCVHGVRSELRYGYVSCITESSGETEKRNDIIKALFLELLRNTMKYLAPDYVYTPRGLQSGMLVSIAEDGRIASISPRLPDNVVTDVLPGVLLLPGFVNVHSHVFQRTLRGRTHHALSSQDTFWTWRHAMYEAAARLDPDRLYDVALRTYSEMLAAGYTSVGEFHYVHHQPGGVPYTDAIAMSHAILQAGKQAGIHMVLLMTAYAQGSFNRPPDEEQRRFCDRSIEAFLKRVDDLRLKGHPVGIAPHSVRAVPEL